MDSAYIWIKRVWGLQYANFDIQNGVLGTVTGGSAVITSIGSGWYRCSFYLHIYKFCNSHRFKHSTCRFWTATRGSALTASNKSVYAWGAQLEQRSTAALATPQPPLHPSQTTSLHCKQQPLVWHVLTMILSLVRAKGY